MSETILNVERREATGKNANRRLRAAGLVPAVVYGAGKEAVSIQVDRKLLLDMLRTTGADNAVFLLHLAGTKHKRHTMIRDMSVHPLTRSIQHVDFQRVLMDEKVRVQVAIVLVGEAMGVKDEGGVLDFVTREVGVECLPGDIPQHFEVDVTELQIGDHLEFSDLELPPGVELLEDESRVIAALAHARVELEEEEDEEELLIEATADEPEVIGRGKTDEEDEG